MAEIEGGPAKLDNLLSTMSWRDRHRSYYGNGELVKAGNSSAPFSSGVQYDNNLGKRYGGRFAGRVQPRRPTLPTPLSLPQQQPQAGQLDPRPFLSEPAARPHRGWLERLDIRRRNNRNDAPGYVQQPYSMPARLTANNQGYSYSAGPLAPRPQTRYDGQGMTSAPADLYPYTNPYSYPEQTNHAWSPQELSAFPPTRVGSVNDSIAPDDSASIRYTSSYPLPQSVHAAPEPTAPLVGDGDGDGDAHGGPDHQAAQNDHSSGLYSASNASAATGVAPPTILNPQIPQSGLRYHLPATSPPEQDGAPILEHFTPIADPEKLGVDVNLDEVEDTSSLAADGPADLSWPDSPLSPPEDVQAGQEPTVPNPATVEPLPSPLSLPYTYQPTMPQTTPAVPAIPSGQLNFTSLDYKDFLMRHTWDSSQRTDFGFSPPAMYTTVEISGEEPIVERRLMEMDEMLPWLMKTAFLGRDRIDRKDPLTKLIIHTCHPSMIQDIRLLPFADVDDAAKVFRLLHVPMDHFSTMIGASQCPPLVTHGPDGRISLRIQTAAPSTGFISIAVTHDPEENLTTGFLWLEEGFTKLEEQLFTLCRYASHPLLYAILVLVLQNELFTRRNIELSSEIEAFNEKLEPGLRKIAEDDIISILALTNISTPKFAMETCRRIDHAIGVDAFGEMQKTMTSNEVRDFFRVVESAVYDNYQWHDQLKTQFDQERQAIYWMLQRQDTQIALKDSSRMKSIAILTMVFLPATAVATIFSMSPFFDNKENNDSSTSNANSTITNPFDPTSPTSGISLVVSRDFWIFWSAVLPITILTILAYASWTQRRELWKFLRHPTWYLITRPKIRRAIHSGRYTASEKHALQTEIRLLEEDLGKPARARRALRRLVREEDANSLFGDVSGKGGGGSGNGSGGGSGGRPEWSTLGGAGVGSWDFAKEYTQGYGLEKPGLGQGPGQDMYGDPYTPSPLPLLQPVGMTVRDI